MLLCRLKFLAKKIQRTHYRCIVEPIKEDLCYFNSLAVAPIHLYVLRRIDMQLGWNRVIPKWKLMGFRDVQKRSRPPMTTYTKKKQLMVLNDRRIKVRGVTEPLVTCHRQSNLESKVRVLYLFYWHKCTLRALAHFELKTSSQEDVPYWTELSESDFLRRIVQAT